MHNLRSTFPLNEAAITRATLGKIFIDPITWVPLMPIVAAYTYFDVPGWITLPLSGVVAVSVGSYWRKQWSGLWHNFQHKLIVDHNRAQDTFLQTAAAELRVAGAAHDAVLLSKFIKLKSEVERRLHQDGVVTNQKIQLDQLVDSLCFRVRDQLAAMAQVESELEPAQRLAMLAQVTFAYETLKSICTDLDLILGPSDMGEDEADQSLAAVTRRLREEADIAKRVQVRLHQAEAQSARLISE